MRSTVTQSNPARAPRPTSLVSTNTISNAGHCLPARGRSTMSERFLAQLSFPPRSAGEVADRGAYHVHLGTVSVSARIRALKDSETSAVIVTATTPVPVMMGDRFILRDTGRRAVIAGGTVLDPSPTRKPTPSDVATLVHAVHLSPNQRADALVAVHGSIDAAEVDRSSGGGSPTGAVTVGARHLSPEVFALRGRELLSAVNEYHAAIPASSRAPEVGSGVAAACGRRPGGSPRRGER